MGRYQDHIESANSGNREAQYQIGFAFTYHQDIQTDALCVKFKE